MNYYTEIDLSPHLFGVERASAAQVLHKNILANDLARFRDFLAPATPPSSIGVVYFPKLSNYPVESG